MQSGQQNPAMVLLGKAYAFFVKRWLVIALSAILGIVLGVIIHLSSDKVYKSEATFTSPYLTNNVSEFLFAPIQELIGKSQDKTLATLLGVDSTTAKQLVDLKTDYTINPMFMQDALPVETYFKVELKVKDPALIPVFEKALLYYLNNKVPYLQKKREIFLNSAEVLAKEADININIAKQIDSLIAAGKASDLGELNIVDASHGLKYKEEILFRAALSDCAYVIVPFYTAASPSWPNAILLLPAGMLLGIALGIAVVLFFDVLKQLKTVQ